MSSKPMMIRAMKHYIQQLEWFRDHVNEESYHFFDNDISLCKAILKRLEGSWEMGGDVL